jgi:hypothetical protein
MARTSPASGGAPWVKLTSRLSWLRRGNRNVTSGSINGLARPWRRASENFATGGARADCDVNRAVPLDETVVGAGWARQERRGKVSSSVTTLIVLISLIHIAAFVVMIVIRVRRNEVDGTAGRSALIRPCAMCGQPATHRSYDGLDPNEQRDPYTGRSYSTDMAYYQLLCAAH